MEELEEQRENFGIALSETAPDWRTRCYRMSAALGINCGDPDWLMPDERNKLQEFTIRAEAAETKLAEVERERDRLGENGYVITAALAEAQRELVKETQRADENYADFTAEQKLRTTAEAALATAQGQLAEADAAITSLHYPNHNEKHWLDAIARHKARAAGKGTE